MAEGDIDALLFSEQFLKKQMNEKTDLWKYTYLQIHQVVYIKHIQFLVCQSHLSIVVKKKKAYQQTNQNNYY